MEIRYPVHAYMLALVQDSRKYVLLLVTVVTVNCAQNLNLYYELPFSIGCGVFGDLSVTSNTPHIHKELLTGRLFLS